jgi:hypothetical protein
MAQERMDCLTMQAFLINSLRRAATLISGLLKE